MKFYISIFFLILLNTSKAQISKLLPENELTINEFGSWVSIYDDLISVGEHNYYLAIDSNNNWYQFMISAFHKNGNSIDLVKKIPDQTGAYSFSETFSFPFQFKDNMVLYNYWNSGNKGLINLYKNTVDTYSLVDSVALFTKNLDYEIHSISNLATNGSWIAMRKRKYFKTQFNELINESWDYFYKIINGKIEKIDSVLFQKMNDTNFGITRRVTTQINDQFCYFSYREDNTFGQRNGSVTIYQLRNDKWELFQTLVPPNTANGNTRFGSDLEVSKDGRFISVSALRFNNTYDNVIYIYEFKGDKYELFQTIPMFWNSNLITLPMSIDGEKLFIGDHYSGIRGEINYFELTNGQFQFRSKIRVPSSDIYCNYFGFSIDHDGETLIVGAVGDSTFGLRPIQDDVAYNSNGAAYVFQVPARDTLDISICEGESYWFGEEVLTMSGVYRDTLLASYGVDSVLVLNLSVLPPLESEVDTILCSGQELTVGDHTLEEAGYYTIPLKTIYGCDSIVSVSLSYAYLDMEAEVNPDFGCQNGKISLLIQGNNPPYSYQWSNGAITSENLSDLSPGLYAVTVTDRSGCSFTLNDIEIKEEKVFELPNAFIPSSQMEENQRFRPYLFPGFEETVTITEMDVFNRFGEKVYSGTDTMGWDGTFRGEPSPPGSYLFRILLSTPCGEEMRTGSLLLVR